MPGSEPEIIYRRGLSCAGNVRLRGILPSALRCTGLHRNSSPPEFGRLWNEFPKPGVQIRSSGGEHGKGVWKDHDSGFKRLPDGLGRLAVVPYNRSFHRVRPDFQ
jgi:hypothetical protein